MNDRERILGIVAACGWDLEQAEATWALLGGARSDVPLVLLIDALATLQPRKRKR